MVLLFGICWHQLLRTIQETGLSGIIVSDLPHTIKDRTFPVRRSIGCFEFFGELGNSSVVPADENCFSSILRVIQDLMGQLVMVFIFIVGIDGQLKSSGKNC